MQRKITYPGSFIPGTVFVVLAWLVKLFELASGFSLSFLGLYPQHWQGLAGIFTSPFLHGGFEHLLSNTFPMFFLSALAFQLYPRLFWSLSTWLVIATGFWTWCFARESYHIGASGLVYGLASFLFFAGVWRGKRTEWAVSLLVLLFYSSLLLGLVPKDIHISWESHLSGFLAGGSYAYFSRKWALESTHSENEPSEAQQDEDVLQLTEIYFKKNKEDSFKKIYSNSSDESKN